ncbi:MAG: HEAT repeat domain-containing protein, partial [Phycisphaerae bacterium]
LEPAEDAGPEPAVDPREAEAVELLDTGGVRQRIRGLELLAGIEDPDLFEWCAMYLKDGSVAVRLAALHTMLRCEQIDPKAVAPLARSADKRVRGAALAVLARHGGEDAERWFQRGLKDPEPCVRLETAAVLSQLDPAEHRAIFQLALYDPNPKIAEMAGKLIAGKGFPRLTWGRGPSRYGGE